MAQRRDRITRGRLGPWEKVWAWFAGFTLGFGYQPWRALFGLAFALGLALVLVFSSIGTNGLGPVTITNQTSTTSLDGTPISGPILTVTTPQVECGAAERASVAVDIAIPLVKTTTSAACTPNTSYAGTWFTLLALFLRTLAWAAAALFVVGFTSIIRKT